MPRIDVTEDEARKQYACPECESRDWVCCDGQFRCRNCQVNVSALLNLVTGLEIPRNEFEFVGPHAHWKAPYATGRGD